MRGLRLFKANKLVRRFLKRAPWYIRHDVASGKYRKTRVFCSCYGCGNPRKVYGNGHEGKKFQEIKQNITYTEELNEV